MVARDRIELPTRGFSVRVQNILSTRTQMENLLGRVQYFGELGTLNPLNGQEATGYYWTLNGVVATKRLRFQEPELHQR